MKIRYKGCLNDINKLPKGNLPNNAIKFKEPSSPMMVNIVCLLYIVPIYFILKGIVLIVLKIHGNVDIGINAIGFLLALLATIPHEFLHAIWFPKKAEVQMFFIPKSLMIGVACTQPITKLNFLWMSLCPNLILGWIPLIMWCFIPSIPTISNILFSFSLISICIGCGDYMNIVNASIQMPRKSFHQLSGFNSYWFETK